MLSGWDLSIFLTTVFLTCALNKNILFSSYKRYSIVFISKPVLKVTILLSNIMLVNFRSKHPIFLQTHVCLFGCNQFNIDIPLFPIVLIRGLWTA